MKFLSYNISWSKQSKIDWLFTNKDIDAFIVPECGNSHNVAVPNDYQFYLDTPVNYKLYTWDETNRMSDHVPIAIELK